MLKHLGTMGSPETQIAMRTIGIDPASASVVRLEMYFGDVLLAVGSSFLWKSSAGAGLVTAWHNLTGTHPATRQPISRNGGRPDRIKATFKTGNSGQDLILNQPLYDSSGRALWKVHPVAAEQVDIALLKLLGPIPDTALASPVNELVQQPIAAPVGAEAFIVGYPKGIVEGGLPIWKRASIASEPDLFRDEEGSRRILIDSASREGMSGAPVFLRSIGSFLSDNGALVVGAQIATKFLGLYSGRLAHADALDAQLGIVWPAELIETISKSGIDDSFTLT
ncbi:serine protease [Sphingorhabdus pulchriflava]|uniref:Serine protease n=1 Tax=Sphingorhabdus pulchriflava TaxID=2292257 RepID=A0A371BJV3_9SPHN|nr:serine protease [Sphingorhabdus pulchriflava]RDV07641.1 serine protease [Sphingorhabdus pulchriflava]